MLQESEFSINKKLIGDEKNHIFYNGITLLVVVEREREHLVKYYRRYIRICILFYRTETMEEILEEQAEQLYPLKEKAECHVAYLQGARCAVKVYATEIGERLIKAYETGEISKEVVFKLVEILKS